MLLNWCSPITWHNLFQFLQSEFLGYLEEWKQAVQQRPGDYGKAERNQMFLSYQTYEGLQMTG